MDNVKWPSSGSDAFKFEERPDLLFLGFSGKDLPGLMDDAHLNEYLTPPRKGKKESRRRD